MLEKDHVSRKTIVRPLYVIEILKLDIFDCIYCWLYIYILTDQKKYINFIEMYRKAYPGLKKEKYGLVVVGGGLM